MNEGKTEIKRKNEKSIYLPQEGNKAITYVSHLSDNIAYRVDIDRKKSGSIVRLTDIGGSSFGTHYKAPDTIYEDVIHEEELEEIYEDLIDSGSLEFDSEDPLDHMGSLPEGLWESLAFNYRLDGKTQKKASMFHEAQYPNDGVVKVLGDIREMVELSRETEAQHFTS